MQVFTMTCCHIKENSETQLFITLTLQTLCRCTQGSQETASVSEPLTKEHSPKHETKNVLQAKNTEGNFNSHPQTSNEPKRVQKSIDIEQNVAWI